MQRVNPKEIRYKNYMKGILLFKIQKMLEHIEFYCMKIK